MKIPGQHHREPALQGEAMTPMIDVVFLLLVFFVCASIGQLPDALLPAELGRGVTESDVELEPPAPDPKEPEHQEVRVGLRPGADPGTVIMELNEQRVPTPAELRRRLIALSRIDPMTRLVLDVDDQATWQQFISLYDLCQALDFQSISFGVRN